jgi:hypothetical protein
VKANRNFKAQMEIVDPGKGKRTASLWGQWLVGKLGLQRQILNGMQSMPMYQGTADPIAVAKRRAKNKVARRSRRINRMQAHR